MEDMCERCKLEPQRTSNSRYCNSDYLRESQLTIASTASAWNGHGMWAGTVTTHSWNDEAEDDETEPGGERVNEKLEVDPSYYSSNSRTPRRRRGRMGW